MTRRGVFELFAGACALPFVPRLVAEPELATMRSAVTFYPATYFFSRGGMMALDSSGELRKLANWE